MSERENWKPGDVIFNPRWPDDTTSTGGENYFLSEDSSDPFLEMGWKLVISL